MQSRRFQSFRLSASNYSTLILNINNTDILLRQVHRLKLCLPLPSTYWLPEAQNQRLVWGSFHSSDSAKTYKMQMTTYLIDWIERTEYLPCFEFKRLKLHSWFVQHLKQKLHKIRFWAVDYIVRENWTLFQCSRKSTERLTKTMS